MMYIDDMNDKWKLYNQMKKSKIMMKTWVKAWKIGVIFRVTGRMRLLNVIQCMSSYPSDPSQLPLKN